MTALPSQPAAHALYRLTAMDHAAKAAPGYYRHDGAGWLCLGYAALYAWGNTGANPAFQVIPGAKMTWNQDQDIVAATVSFSRPGAFTAVKVGAGVFPLPAMPGRTSFELGVGAWAAAAAALAQIEIEDDGTRLICSAKELVAAQGTSWPWVTVDPDADPPPVPGGYYGGGDVWHAWMWVDGLNVPTGWTEDASWFLRTTGEAAYFHLGTAQWVYSGNREIHCRCHGSGPSYCWHLARLDGVIEQEGIYAVYDPDSDAFFWYVGNPTRPGEDVYAYCLAEADTPPITVWENGIWSIPNFELWPDMPV